MIRKSGEKWCLYTKKKDKSGKRRKLGCYSSKKGAENREKQVNMFKHLKEANAMKLSRRKLKKIIQEELQDIRNEAKTGPTSAQPVVPGGGGGKSFDSGKRVEIPVPSTADLARADTPVRSDDPEEEEKTSKGRIRSIMVDISKVMQTSSKIQIHELNLLITVIKELLDNAIAGNLGTGAAKQILTIALNKVDQATGNKQSPREL